MPDLETIGPTPTGNWTYTGTVNLAYLVLSGKIIASTSIQAPIFIGSSLILSGTSQNVWFIGSGGGLFASETSQKIGFYGKTPLVQQNSVAPVSIAVGTDGICVAINNLIARLGSLGLISMTS